MALTGKDNSKPAAATSSAEDDGLDDEDFLVLGNHSDNERNDKDKVDDDDDNDDDDGYDYRYNKETDLPPWMQQHVDYRRVNHVVALHNEIVGFCKLMEPRQEEMKQRRDLVESFTKLAKSAFQGCQVDVFGSQATGLCLPTSDIDIAIQLSETDTKTMEEGGGADSSLENWDAPTDNPLHRLAAALRGEWLKELSYLEVIENTRVPLVKFTHEPTNICVDVCFNQTTGVQAAQLMLRFMEALPPLRPLTFVLKYFMAARGLNQPYTGGVGSFLLQMMIVSFLQQRERDALNNRRPSLQNLGSLLIEFFELYSTDFNFVTTGISVRFDGFYFPKGATERKKDFWQENRPFSLAMENPFEVTADVGISSFRMSVVQKSFDVGFKILLSHVTEPVDPTISILASILPPTDEMRKRSTSRLLGPLGSERSTGEPPRKRTRR